MGFKVASRVRGLSDAAFGTEEQCRAALARLCRGDGFACPGCGHHTGTAFRRADRSISATSTRSHAAQSAG